MNIVGQRIRIRREELGFSQDKLAQMLGYVSRSSIAKIENGTNQLTQPKIEEFAKKLGVPVAYLIGLEEQISPKWQNCGAFNQYAQKQLDTLPMKGIELQLRNYILAQYNTLSNFSKQAKIPYSTLDSIFKRGINNCTIANIVKICSFLNISIDELLKGNISTLGK